MKELLKKYPLSCIYYVKGPGSFMAIKISYIFLKTISISLGVPMYACDGFEVNENTPIKAFGKSYFVKDGDNVVLKVFDKEVQNSIRLPQNLDNIQYTKDIEPMYILPAI